MKHYKTHVQVSAFDMYIANVLSRKSSIKDRGIYGLKNVQIKDLWKRLNSLKTNTWQFKELVTNVSWLTQEVPCILLILINLQNIIEELQELKL